jgi:hypothetical protein
VPDRLTPDGRFTLAAQLDLFEGEAGSIAALCQYQALAFALEHARADAAAIDERAGAGGFGDRAPATEESQSARGNLPT